MFRVRQRGGGAAPLAGRESRRAPVTALSTGTARNLASRPPWRLLPRVGALILLLCVAGCGDVGISQAIHAKGSSITIPEALLWVGFCIILHAIIT